MILIVVTILACASIAQGFKQCEADPAAILRVKHITEPVILQKGKRFEADFDIDIKRKFPPTFKAVISLQRKVWFAWVPLPCINQVGSCTYDVTCDMLNKLQIENGGVINHKCPAEAGQTVSQKVGITLPDIPGPVKVLGSGTYWARAKLVGSDGRVLACVEKTMEIKSP
ncbi:ganglioside GM2 activator-like [Hydractinia symbiolongicarpus]|uniref:ganglioside GM2 activator-like n=1 Tax=Hydractinia symbiolongicarpus TaxID=13093 RepID=UPI00254A028D|nr:ganglioside GM2 activator-like [Hydractinia symbiolongicarpus]